LSDNNNVKSIKEEEVRKYYVLYKRGGGINKKMQ
jgi:hypothetical protein